MIVNRAGNIGRFAYIARLHRRGVENGALELLVFDSASVLSFVG